MCVAAAQVVFVTTDTFLGEDGAAREVGLVDRACSMVRDGTSDLALRIKVKDAGETVRWIASPGR